MNRTYNRIVRVVAGGGRVCFRTGDGTWLYDSKGTPAEPVKKKTLQKLLEQGVLDRVDYDDRIDYPLTPAGQDVAREAIAKGWQI